MQQLANLVLPEKWPLNWCMHIMVIIPSLSITATNAAST